MTRDPATIAERLRSAGCVWAEDEAALLIAETDDDGELARRIARRVAGEPLETVVGWALFHGLRIAVAPGVFVPRRRTEFLVDVALELIPPDGFVADVCCGSGALGAAVRAARPGIRLVASDLDPVAVAVARRNLPGVPVSVGDLMAPLPPGLAGRIDVVLANVPYVPAPELVFLPPEAREHEPRRTLDGGPDGLDVLRRLALEAPEWLRPGGALLSEVGAGQLSSAVSALRAAGLDPRARHSADGETTVVVGTRVG